MNSKKWLKYLILNIIVFFSLIVFFNYIIDPFQHYRKASIYTFDYSGNQKYLNPGLAKNYEYNSIIIGTSMTENFSLEKTKYILNNPIKLSIAGGKAFEFKELLDISFNTHKIETVLFGLDIYSFLNDRQSNKLPYYLYDNNIFNDYKYLLSLDTLKRSFYVLFSKNNDKSKVEDNYNHMFEWQNKYQKNFRLENVINNWNERDIKFNHAQSFWNLIQLRNNFDLNLYKLILENKNIKFIIFFPPYSILTYKDWEEKESLNTILKFKEYIYDKFLPLSNVELFDFQITKEITHNLNNYKDITHYSQDINYWILEQINKNNFLLNTQNKDNIESTFRNQLIEYKINFN
ncbi:hypothetical protein [Arcobacter defluvii]|uniref:Uncharacterized protein n=1 Tax=Arcobacter defluvii TaxID=873191 RepID=A0AAE7BI32_9BACT|nr:hypothetical protein [Arcobacter defluvii]QKF78376.1 hypothetical protein ADFLV_2381 [Arcobacter defluvii]RXI30838.1 hypothetical protein CP964_11375 [Arcobacter defluvii]